MSPGEETAARNRSLRPLVVMGASLAVTFVALLLSIGFAAAGHGSYLPATLLFPIPMLTTQFTLHMSLIAIGLAIVQWPVYAAFVLYGARRNHLEMTAGLIALVHLGSVILAVALLPDAFS